MKKRLIFNFGRILCLMLMMSPVLVACTESSEGSGEETPITAIAGYSFSMNNNYLNLVDATVTYWNDKGEQKTEPLTSMIWYKSFDIKQTQEVGYTVNVTPKSNIDELLTADSYKLGYTHGYSYMSSDGKGNSQESSFSLTVPKDKIKEYLIQHGEIYKFSVKWDDEAKKFITNE